MAAPAFCPIKRYILSLIIPVNLHLLDSDTLKIPPTLMTIKVMNYQGRAVLYLLHATRQLLFAVLVVGAVSGPALLPLNEHADMRVVLYLRPWDLLVSHDF